ncbi:hypothetical protein ONZ45_g7765 [Pleurotus djamor]|nr:hypothetical protein ONZ45_g7765 [Pleurotus djamor]
MNGTSHDRPCQCPPIIYNNNYGSGVFNYVVGTQSNYNGLITIERDGLPNPGGEPRVHLELNDSYRLQPFLDVIDHLDVICSLVAAPTTSSSSSSVLAHLRQIREHLSYAHRAFDVLIVNFPDTINSFHYFKQFEAFNQCSTPTLLRLRYLIQASQGQSSITQRRVLNYLDSRHDWIDAVKAFLKGMRPRLESFLRIVSSRWVEHIESSTPLWQITNLTAEIRRACYPTFRHLKFDCFFLKDHLGNQVPIPLVFCTNWIELNTIIHRLCKSLDGAEYISNGLWELINASDAQVIHRDRGSISNFIISEHIYEISIILRLLVVSTSQCPQCRSSHLDRGENGWKACSCCGTKFKMNILPDIISSDSKVLTSRDNGLNSTAVLVPSVLPTSSGSRLKRLGSVLSKVSPTRLSFSKRLPRVSVSGLKSSSVTSPSTSISTPLPLDLTEHPSTNKFRRISIRAPPQGSLAWIEEYLSKLLCHANPSYQKPSPEMNPLQRVSLLVEDLFGLAPTPPEGLKRQHSLAELVILVKSIARIFPQHHLNIPRLVASLGNSEILPQARAPSPNDDHVFCRLIVWGRDGNMPTFLSSSKTTFYQWSPSNGNMVVAPYQSEQADVYISTIHSSGKFIALAYWSAMVRVYKASTGALVSTISLQKKSRVSHFAFSPAGQSLATGSIDFHIRIWNFRTGRKRGRTLKGHLSNIIALVFAPDGRKLASGSHDDTIRVWDALTGQALFVYEVNLRSPAMTWSPDGRYLVHAVYDGYNYSCVVQDVTVATGKTATRLVGDSRFINSLAFAPDGKQIVANTGLWEATISLRVWDVETWRLLAIFSTAQRQRAIPSVPHRQVASVAFSPNGQFIAAISDYGDASVWTA